MFILDVAEACNDYAIARVLSLIKFAYQTICILVPIFLIVAASIQIASMVANPDQKDAGKKIGQKFIFAVLVFLLPWITNFAMNFLKISGLPISSVSVVSCWNAGSEVNATLGDPTEFLKVEENAKSGLIGDLSALKIYSEKKLQNIQGQAGGFSGSILDGGLPIPIYYQSDYPQIAFNASESFPDSGCGFTSVSMVISYLTGEAITPDKFTTDEAKTHYEAGAGMRWSLPEWAASKYGVGSVIQTSNATTAYNALKNGQAVICSQGPGGVGFTNGGHIIVLRGLDENGKVLVNDPNYSNAVGRGFNARRFDMNSEIAPTAKQYWIFEKKKG